MSDDLERRVLAALTERGVPYELVPCEPAHADTAVFCERHGFPPSMAANAIVVSTKREPRRHACCVVLATHRLDVNRAVRELLGGKVSFAKADAMRELTGMEVGGVTPFALPDDLPVYLCESLMDCERVIVGTGGRRSKVLVPPSALADLPSASVVPRLSEPRVSGPCE